MLASLFVLGCQQALAPDVITNEPTSGDSTNLSQSFNSSELGLSFWYSPMSVSGKMITVTVDNNKVIIGEAETPGADEELIIHDLNGMTPQDYIAKTFITGKDATLCEVAEYEGGGDLPQGAQYWGIKVKDDIIEEPMEIDCGPHGLNGVWYFLSFERAPSRIIEVEIGQDTVMSDDSWRETIQLEDLFDLK